MNEIFFLLILLQIKHWYIDFVNQSKAEVKGKAIYGDTVGLGHSVKHGIGTCLCILLAFGIPYLLVAIIMGFFDLVLHYHIDWTKMNKGNRDITTPAFWNHLGLDQMAHQLTYIGIAYILTT